MKNIFFDSWESIIRTAIITVMAYLLLIFLLRVSGKRTLSKMNAFDFIVTIALGSTLATVLLNKNVALADGVLAFFLLIFLQYAITYLAARSKRVSQLVKSTPTLLVYKGRMLQEFMLKERINEDEIHAIVREKGFSTVAAVDAVVLETDGSLTVIKKADDLQASSLSRVEKPGSLA
ncbi:MAG TPA: YetF domain-containing protein [Flavisolibacter sp.]|nr:YetF domain-containing protein [Flavisolibacter sp.]